MDIAALRCIRETVDEAWRADPTGEAQCVLVWAPARDDTTLRTDGGAKGLPPSAPPPVPTGGRLK